MLCYAIQRNRTKVTDSLIPVQHACKVKLLYLVMFKSFSETVGLNAPKHYPKSSETHLKHCSK